MSREKLRASWAKYFPSLNEKHSHWWIEGDGYCLGVIEGGNLSAAIDLVEDHWEKYASIKTYKAKLLDTDIIRKDRHSSEVSNRENSQKIIDE